MPRVGARRGRRAAKAAAVLRAAKCRRHDRRGIAHLCALSRLATIGGLATAAELHQPLLQHLQVGLARIQHRVVRPRVKLLEAALTLLAVRVVAVGERVERVGLARRARVQPHGAQVVA
eukprot:357281-Chlamydomonas_euryale.AAC.5